MTGVGTLGYDSVAEALTARPAQMVSVSPENWGLLGRSYEGGALAEEFDGAWQNGVALLEATDGLRGRRPVTIEWKGSHRAPGDEVAPIDLRIDHVYLVSCKYLSKITINASPFHLFERLLQGGHGAKSGDWYSHVAASSYRQLYAGVRAELPGERLPAELTDLRGDERRALSKSLKAEWPGSTGDLYHEFVDAVSLATATAWRDRLASPGEAESLLWRLLRMGSAPYFVLGAAAHAPIRLRIATPWDWRGDFRLSRFEIAPQAGGQPRVGWTAVVERRHSGLVTTVDGHVEIRWSHGRFGGNPEAKVYLDTPHAEVPGYYELA